jgi:tetratricopeptide (TPR) repeat protein
MRLNNLAPHVRDRSTDSALRHYPKHWRYWCEFSRRPAGAQSHGIGATYYRIGDRGEALKYFERALALRPASDDPVRRIASLRSAADTLRTTLARSIRASRRGAASRACPHNARICGMARDAGQRRQRTRERLLR